MRFNRIGLGIAGLAMATLISTATTAQSEQILRGAAGNAGAASHAIMTIFAKIANRETGVSIQINDGQTLTKTTLSLGLDKLDITPTVPAIYNFLTKGTRMYRKVKDRAKTASGNVRGLGYLMTAFTANKGSSSVRGSVTLALAWRMWRGTDARLLWKFAWNFGWKGMRSVQRFKKRLKKGEVFPPFLYISITNTCNLRCQGCWVDVTAKRNIISFEDLDRLITRYLGGFS